MKRLVATVGAFAFAVGVLSSGAWAQGTTTPTKDMKAGDMKAADPKAAVPATPATPAKPAAKAATDAKPADAKKGGHQVDLNTASAADLKAAGFTDDEAAKIIAGRPYKRKDELVHKHIVSEESYKKAKNGIIAHQLQAEKKK